jgi:gliding motility-associated-like protein
MMFMGYFDKSFKYTIAKGMKQSITKDCSGFFLFLFFFCQAFFANAQADLPNPPANIQTATKGSLVIAMDNVNQAVVAPFNLKAYGLINALLQNDIPVKWIIRSGKIKDAIDFSVSAQRLYPSFVAASTIDFRSSAFIIDSAYVNNSYYGFGKNATQVIAAFAGNVAVYKLMADVNVDVRYTLTQHPKIAVFNNGGNQLLQSKILDAAGIPDYVDISAGVFSGLAACYTFCSEAHWDSQDLKDTAITNRVRSFVKSGGNFLAQCYGVDTYENYEFFHSDKGTKIKNATVTNAYYNPDMAYMQFMGTIVSNQSGAERNWVRNAGSLWSAGFYYCVSQNPNKDTVVVGAAHTTAANLPGGNVFYLGGHDYFDGGASDWTNITHINAARLYLNAALIPSDRPSAFVASAGTNKSICIGQAVTLGAAPTGPAGSTYTWQPGKSLNDSTVANPVATPTVTTTYGVFVDNGGCPQASAVTVTVKPLPTANAGTTVAVCPGNPVANLNGSVTNATGGIWSGGAGSYNPNNTTLTAAYTPTAAEIAAGTVTLTLTTTGIGTCIPVTSHMNIVITPPLVASIASPAIVCFGKKATLTASGNGGTAPYTYSWSSTETTASVNNKSPGTFTVTITDATNQSCTKTAAVTINEDPQLSLSTSSNTVATCTSTANISASGVGGSGAYTYSWSTGQTVSAINVNTGNYVVTITDAAGCTVTDAILVKSAVNGTLSLSVNPPADACFGGGTSTLTAIASGGFGAYTYSWNTGPTTSSITAAKGTYCMTVKDSIGCISNACGTIKEEPQLTVSIVPALICLGATANIISTPSGGTGPYTYSWNTGETTSSISRVAGTYTVTITDANSHNCSVAASINVLQSPAMTLASSTIITSCKGSNDGQASVSISSGGTTPFTYSWSPVGGTGITTTNVSAGIYTVTVTDKIGCTSTKTAAVPEPAVVAAATSVVKSVSCNGGGDGSAAVTASGGNGGYSYLWSTGSTAITVTGLVKGNYIVTVTDSKGCTIFSTVAITQPAVLTTTAAVSTNVSCNGGSNGTAVATPTGGNGNYTYAWATAGGTAATGTGLSNGTYTVTVTDSKGCTITSTVSITQPTILTGAAATSVNIKCFGNNTGKASVSASGGKPGYLYSWTPSGGTGLTATGLVAATYTVSITDANACVKTVTTTVTEPPQLTVQASPTAYITCSSTVVISANANGGTGAYAYSWNTGNITSSLITVNTGHYSVVVKDANSCTAKDTVSVVALNSTLEASVTAPASICSGSTTNITVNVTPGISPYSYSWNTGELTATITASAGTHCATITDQNNCKSTSCVNIVADSITGITIPVDTICFGNTATLTATVSGGSTPYTYSWNTTETIQSVIKAAGTYTVTVKDAIACAHTASVTVLQAPNLNVAFTNNFNVSCFAGNNGIAQANVSGGKPVYKYKWSTSVNDTLTNVDGLIAGAYTVTISDNMGCTKTAATIITQPAAQLKLDSTFTNVTCFGMNNGTAKITVSGGTAPYSYSWLTSGNTSTVQNGLKPGKYYASVIDAHNCFVSNIITITEPPLLTLAASKVKDVSCKAKNDGSIAATVTGGAGAYTYAWSASAATGPTNSGLAAGTYTVTVVDANNCVLTSSAAITEPPVLLSSASKVDVLCKGANTGSASVSVSGGNSGYTYSWIPAVTTASGATGIMANNYTVQVTDAKGCTTSTTFSITEPPALNLVPSTTNATCTTANGTATATVTGGKGQYTYSWSAGTATGKTLSGIPAGTYTVIVTDGNGCTMTNAILVNNIAGPVATASTTANATCFATCNGTAKVTATAGSPPYTYSWSSVPAKGASSVTGLCAGNYYAKVTDSNTCADSVLVTITEPKVVSVLADSVATLCIGQTTLLTVKTSGGSGGYTFTWLPSGPTVSPIVTSTYTVTAKDIKGCTSAALSVTVPVHPPVTLTTSDTIFCKGSKGTITALAKGGDSMYVYTWMPGNLSTPSISASTGVNYTVTVNDGCGTPSTSGVIKVGAYPLPIVSVTPSLPVGCIPVCINFSNLSAISNGIISGWQWDFGDTTAVDTLATPTHCYMKKGDFTVAVTAISDKGCKSKVIYDSLITAHSLPNPTFSFTPKAVSYVDPVAHFDNYLGKDVVSWKWNFGDSKTDDTLSIKNPVHTYADTGRYCIKLIVKNIFGCVDSSVNCLRVYPVFTFYVPNAFTPNDDGINDVFGGVGMFIKNYKMDIFDRWGQLIFVSNDINKKWDGIANYGYVPAQQDVYVYRIWVTDIFNYEYSYIGHVTLLK